MAPVGTASLPNSRLISMQGVAVLQEDSDYVLFSRNHLECSTLTKVNNDIASHNLERHKGSLENEEIITSSNTECLVNITTGESNKWGRDGKVCHHLIHA